VLDLRKREVSNWVWLFTYPIGCAMILTGWALNLLDMQTVLVSFLVSIVLGVVLLYLGFYGGADVKALVFVGLTLPTLPVVFSPDLGVPTLPLILVVFCNSALLSMVWPLSIFILNLKDSLQGKSLFEGIKLSMREKVLLLFTARRIPLEDLEKKSLKYFPAETVAVQEEESNKPIRKLYFVL
jgi:hypothetical protein